MRGSYEKWFLSTVSLGMPYATSSLALPLSTATSRPRSFLLVASFDRLAPRGFLAGGWSISALGLVLEQGLSRFGTAFFWFPTLRT